MKANNDIVIREQVDRLGRPDIEMLDREIERLECTESLRQIGFDLLRNLVVAAAVIIIITNLWVTVLQIDGSSMNPLLHDEEIVLAIECDVPKRSDVIAFNQNNKLFIKRVIATEGESVVIDSEGVVSVNGDIVDEPYVTGLGLGNNDITFPYTIPQGAVFVLGDNREISSDSRDSKFGLVDVDQIVGKVAFTVWPLSQVGEVQ